MIGAHVSRDLTLVCDWLQLHHVMLQPGEMVWYESAKLLHGRSQPLNGTRLVADIRYHCQKEEIFRN